MGKIKNYPTKEARNDLSRLEGKTRDPKDLKEGIRGTATQFRPDDCQSRRALDDAPNHTEGKKIRDQLRP